MLSIAFPFRAFAAHNIGAVAFNFIRPRVEMIAVLAIFEYAGHLLIAFFRASLAAILR